MIGKIFFGWSWVMEVSFASTVKKNPSIFLSRRSEILRKAERVTRLGAAVPSVTA